MTGKRITQWRHRTKNSLNFTTATKGKILARIFLNAKGRRNVGMATMHKRIFINNQIRADKVRLIGKDGKQLGIFGLFEAIKKAREQGLDLIKITDKVEPPICKIADYGKYLYQLEKKERQHKQKMSEMKNIRLTFGIGEHDMEIRAKAAEDFLKKGNRVRIELVLRGREKALADFARGKLRKFMEILGGKIKHKIEREMKREGRGLTIIITKA